MITPQEADELIQAMAHGDRTALHTLYTEYKQPVFMLALTLTKNKHLAEDIMQDTFVAAYESAASYHPAGKGRSWLLAITKNLSRQQLKREHKYELQEAISPQATAHQPRFEELIEQHSHIKWLLSTLSAKEQDIVLLHVLADIKLTDIAVYLELPLGSVYWSYSNARCKMKRHLLAHPDAVSEPIYR